MDDKIKQGFEGEAIVRDMLIKKGHRIGQIDLISIDKKGEPFLYEIKHQERFKSPPFDGHGLPHNQIKFRVEFARYAKLTPVLVIIEPEVDIFGKKCVFIQDMNKLESLPDKDKHFTKTGKRIIYNLSAFVAYEYDVNTKEVKRI